MSLIWKHIPTQPTKIYYYNIQNVSIVPSSKVYIKIQTSNTPPTDTNGAIQLTARNVLSGILGKDNHLFVAEENGGIVGSVISEYTAFDNFNIPVTHEDRNIAGSAQTINVPKGAMITLQNIGDSPINFSLGGTGRGELITRQIFAIALAKQTNVVVSGKPGGKFTYMITPAVTMTLIDDPTKEKIEKLLAMKDTLDSDLVHYPTVAQIYEMLKRGRSSEGVEVNSLSNTKRIEFPHLKTNNLDTANLELKDNDVLDIDIRLKDLIGYNIHNTNEISLHFRAIIEPNTYRYNITDFYCSEPKLSDYIESLELVISNDNKKIKPIINFSSNFDSINIARLIITNPNIYLVKDTDPIPSSGSRTLTYNIRGLVPAYYTDATDILKYFIPDFTKKIDTINNGAFKMHSATDEEIVFVAEGGTTNVLTLRITSDEIIELVVNPSKFSGFSNFVNIKDIYAIHIQSPYKDTSLSLQLKLLQNKNEQVIDRLPNGDIVCKIPLFTLEVPNRTVLVRSWIKEFADKLKLNTNKNVKDNQSYIKITYINK